MVVATTERAAEAQSIFYYHDKRILDLCTPFALHVGTSVVDAEKDATGYITSNQTHTCASELGFIKWECENANPLLNNPACSDPRYTNWLVNDYGAYPVGTWDYQLCTPGPGCTDVGTPGVLSNGMIRP